MRTNLELQNSGFEDLEVTRADFVGYYHPREIVADPLLTVERKRVLLAHWLSDANVLPGHPAIRRSPAGVTTSVDHLRQAMDHLDEMIEAFALAGVTGRASGMAT